jgi:hypothetical protein
MISLPECEEVSHPMKKARIDDAGFASACGDFFETLILNGSRRASDDPTHVAHPQQVASGMDEIMNSFAV